MLLQNHVRPVARPASHGIPRAEKTAVTEDHAQPQPKIARRAENQHQQLTTRPRRLSSFRLLAKCKMMAEFIHLTRALADPTRVRALLALRGGELCVCQITELFGLAPSTISKHLAVLHQAGLVNQRKEGRWIYYALPGRDAPVAVREALDWVIKTLGRSAEALADRKRLAAIRRCDPSELCRKQLRA
jgi:ArsR family transcriptional regulator